MGATELRLAAATRSVLRRFAILTGAVGGGCRRALRLEVALGHSIQVWHEERDHAQGGDEERHEDEQQVSQALKAEPTLEPPP